MPPTNMLQIDAVDLGLAAVFESKILPGPIGTTVAGEPCSSYWTRLANYFIDLSNGVFAHNGCLD